MIEGQTAGVVGLGTDLVDVARVEGVLQRQGEAFLRRVFTPGERAYCEKKARPAPFFAARFAAKEAAAKAFGTGIGEHIGWLDIEVVHEASGAPKLIFSGKGAALAERAGVGSALVSLTHTDSLAAATVLLQIAPLAERKAAAAPPSPAT